MTGGAAFSKIPVQRDRRPRSASTRWIEPKRSSGSSLSRVHLWMIGIRVLVSYLNSSSDSSSPTSPRSLWQSFETLSMPYLGDRFRLALDLSLTLSLLHISGWLHKAFRSENVVFYPRPNGCREDATSIRHPNILGFEYSRPYNPNAFTDLLITDDHVSNLYRHPKGQRPGGERFSPDFDIYSLGIVLLEIGYWRRISEFWHEGHTLETFRHELYSFHVPRLGPKVGKIYTDVVARCLDKELVNDSVDDVESQNLFYWDVLRELSGFLSKGWHGYI